ncbi:hypothetical protein EVAR_61374_1 [Eumeta japonica]|uniref:Uncharacterized protein n=1 Tax=Eumeta variegata TaxID=151549 RepID=A0A4C1Z5S6_EUMVA|nr:hypothetical protein EVAR_61374_1 [Eumeta japonica]
MNNKNVSQQARLAIHGRVPIPTVMYSGENWLWQKKNESGINAVEMRLLRSTCGVPRKALLKGKRTCQPPERRWSLPSKDTHSTSSKVASGHDITGFLVTNRIYEEKASRIIDGK